MKVMLRYLFLTLFLLLRDKELRKLFGFRDDCDHRNEDDFPLHCVSLVCASTPPL